MKEFFPTEKIRELEKTTFENEVVLERSDCVLAEIQILAKEGEGSSSNGGKYLYTKEIRLKAKNDKEINFSSLLPEGWRFVNYYAVHREYKSEDSVFATCRKDKVVTYGPLGKSGALLALLHEIGHSRDVINNDETDAEDPLEEYTKSYDNRRLTPQEIQERGGQPEDYIEIIMYDAYGKGGGGFDNDEVWFTVWVPRKVVEKHGAHWASEERRAWAYALRALRGFRKEGIHIEATFQNIQQLMDEVLNNLDTYEKHFQKNYKVQSRPFTKGKKFQVRGTLEERRRGL